MFLRFNLLDPDIELKTTVVLLSNMKFRNISVLSLLIFESRLLSLSDLKDAICTFL